MMSSWPTNCQMAVKPSLRNVTFNFSSKILKFLLWQTGTKFNMAFGFYPKSILDIFLARHLDPLGRGRPKSASGGPYSPNRAFLRKLYKTKVAERPWFCIEK